MPIVVAAFDFSLGLRRGRIAQGDAVKMEGLAELGESVGRMGEKEGVIIHVESQREAVDEKGAGKKIEVSGKGFREVKSRPRVEPGGVVENIQKHLFLGRAGEECVRSGVVLPKCAEVADLPAADRFCGLFVSSVGSEVVSDGPTANAGAVGLEIEAAEQLAGDGAVGRARRGTQQTGGQRGRIRRPGRMMIAARESRLPGIGPTLRTGPEIIGAKLVKAGQPHAQLGGQCSGAKLARPPPGKEMTDQRRRKTTGELWFFIPHQ